MITVDLCRHIKTNGLQCHGAALASSVFCYFHNRLHRSHDLYRDKVHFQSAQMKHPLFLELPAMEDRESVQLAISCVVNALATGCIDRKDAMALFYGLQLASTNARGLRIVRRPTQIVRDVYKEGWTSIPEANVDIAPPGRTMEIEEPVELQRIQRPGSAHRTRTCCTHRRRAPNRRRHPERSEGPLYFARSTTTTNGQPATHDSPDPRRSTSR